MCLASMINMKAVYMIGWVNLYNESVMYVQVAHISAFLFKPFWPFQYPKAIQERSI